jgi:hypothetical protein
MCNNVTTVEAVVARILQKIITTDQSYSKAVPRAQKINFSISRYCMHKHSYQRPEITAADSTDGFITNNFTLLSICLTHF